MKYSDQRFVCLVFNPFPHTTISAADNFEHILSKNTKISIIEWITYDLKWKTLWQKEKLLKTFCHYAFKKLSAAEASESVYKRERVNSAIFQFNHSLSWVSSQYYWSIFLTPAHQL